MTSPQRARDARSLDAEVHTALFGQGIVGYVSAWGECGPDSAEAKPGPHPAFIRNCSCEYGRERIASHSARMREEKRFSEEQIAEWVKGEEADWIYGHYWQCFGIVPPYSSTWDAMRLVVERMAERGWRCTLHVSESFVFASFNNGTSERSQRLDGDSRLMPEAASRAALAACAGPDTE